MWSKSLIIEIPQAKFEVWLARLVRNPVNHSFNAVTLTESWSLVNPSASWSLVMAMKQENTASLSLSDNRCPCFWRSVLLLEEPPMVAKGLKITLIDLNSNYYT